MNEGRPYDAFLSYSHADRRCAVRLQRFLESYPIPDRPSLRVYLDVTDIRSGDLSGELQRALHDSQSLLVCCSPSTPDSRWVRREIEVFGDSGREPSIVPIVLSGDPEQVLPSPISKEESRYLDLRGRWWFGLLSPGARLELARGIATIADLPLREVVDWERRRQLRFAGAGAVLVVFAVVAAMLFPLSFQRSLDLSGIISPVQTIEFTEVQENDAIMVAAREVSEGPQGTRNYVECYPDVLRNEERHWLGEGPCWPRRRLLPIQVLPYGSAAELADRFDLDALLDQARGMTREGFGELVEEGDLDLEDVPEPAGPWVGEPYPGMSIALVTIPPLPIDPLDEPVMNAPLGDALIAVADLQGGVHVRRVTGVDPRVNELSVGARSINLNSGSPVAARGDEIWFGLPVRSDGGLGGLWHSSDAGASWERVGEFVSVASVALVPGDEGRVLVATAPGNYQSGIRQLSSESACWERINKNSGWSRLETAPPYSASSRIQFAGFLSDGSWIIQVDSAVYRLGRDNLAQRLLQWLYQ